MASWNAKLDVVMSAWERHQNKEKMERRRAKEAAEKAVGVIKRQKENAISLRQVVGEAERVVHALPENSIRIDECSDTLFFLPDRCSRIALYGCRRCTFVIAGHVVTSVVEMIRCDQVNVIILTDVPTIQIDFCARTVLVYEKADFMKFFYVTKSCGIFASLGVGEIDSPYRLPIDICDFEKDEDWRWHEVQYRVRLTPTGKLKTSPVVRDKQGFPLDYSPNVLEVGFNSQMVRTVPRMSMDKTHPCFVAEHEGGEEEAKDEKEEIVDGEIEGDDEMLFSLEDIPTHGHACVHHSSPPGDPNYDRAKVLGLIKHYSTSMPHVQVDKEGHVEISKEELDLLLKKTALN